MYSYKPQMAQVEKFASPLGLLGGTFDPVHFGHLRLAEEAKTALGLEKVTWIPAGQPPHRSTPGASARHRLEMVRLAIAGNPGFTLDDGETLSEAKSYSVTTLSRLRNLHGAEKPLVLLLGADAFVGLPTWHCWQELFSLAHLAVATRPGYALEPEALPPALQNEFRTRVSSDAKDLGKAPAGRIVAFPITSLAISGTAIRNALAADDSARYLLPDTVLDYIAEHRLYQNPATGH